MGKNVIITGASGMVGGGVLIECLESTEIDAVLIINRKSLPIDHPKLRQIELHDFSKINSLKNELRGYDALFYCMGVSAYPMKEDKYSHLTFDYVKAFADTFYSIHPKITFVYVTGRGTDSSESKGAMWARVKGKTENYILNKGFRHAFMFRPGIIIPKKGVRSRTPLYHMFYVLFRPIYGLLQRSQNITTTERIGRAMIHCLQKPFHSPIIDEKKINQWALL
ncbi:MAG: epimerase [Bacteroidetes bacterium]|nr:epimerase [Bacteroidota bacterium]